MIRRISILLVICAALASFAENPSVSSQDTVNRLAASIYTGPSMTTLRELSDGFGGRLSGSPAYNKAAEWAVAKFRSYGIQNVRLDPFTIPNGWVRGSAHGEFVSPVTRTLHVESLGWSPYPPAGGVKAEVAILDDVSAESIKANADTRAGS